MLFNKKNNNIVISDMNVEKTMLQSTIYPSLRDYCRSQYQLDFQVFVFSFT